MKPVDLIETFNYLDGLRVRRYGTYNKRRQQGIPCSQAVNQDGKRCNGSLARYDRSERRSERAFLEAKYRNAGKRRSGMKSSTVTAPCRITS